MSEPWHIIKCRNRRSLRGRGRILLDGSTEILCVTIAVQLQATGG